MKKIFIYTLAALTVVACSKEDDMSVGNRTVRVSGATTEAEGEDGARAGYDGAKSIWTAGDEIGVTFDADNKNLEFTQVAGSLAADGTTVEFEGKLNTLITGNVQCVAYYPYSSAATVSGKVITTTFPASQNYVAGGYTGIPLFGSYSGNIDNVGIQFRNLFSVIKVSLTKDASLSGETVMLQGIVFKGNNGETVSGAMSVDMSGATPVATYTGSGKRITLNCGSGVELTSVPQTFHIAVPAMNYTQGYSFTIITDKGQVVKSVKTAGANYAPNTIYNTPTLAVKDLVTPIVILDVNLRNLLETLGLITIVDAVQGTVNITAAGLAVANLNLSGGNISSLVGIEHFPALVTLNVADNLLTSLDLSKNLLLATVDVSGNNLSSLTLGANVALATLDASGNALVSLDLSLNLALLNLDLSGNQLTSLDLSHNILLANVNLMGNDLVSLDLSANTALLSLDISNNKLTAVDASKNILLTTLKVSGNQLVTLNISNLALLLHLELTPGVNSIALTKLTVPADATVQHLVSEATKWVTFECKNNPTIITISLKNNALLTGVTVTGNAACTTLDVTNTLLLTNFAISTSGNASGFQIVGKGII